MSLEEESAVPAAKPRPSGWGSRLARTLALVVLGGVLGVAAANGWVLWCGNRYLESAMEKLPDGAVGLVLGTSPTVGGGRSRNPFFVGRIETAARLFHAGKVNRLLLSGDNRRRDYDEPRAMRAALIARGVPARALVLDAAGFRTLDSVVRARAVFGLQRVTIITDDFHQPRAIFLARVAGLEAVGFASPPVALRLSLKTRVRELGSRLKACLDVYVLDTRPRFLGPPLPMDAPPGVET